jgi:1-acyl-sn-glycerol-3-phosphate acyltransferase
MNWILKILRAFGYYCTLVLFGLFGLATGLVGLVLMLFPASPRLEEFLQSIIRANFSLFLWWTDFAQLWHVRFHGFDQLPAGGMVMVGNHPNLTDAVYLLAKVRRAICIFKPSIRRNPVLGAAAVKAGYLASDGGSDLVRAAAEKVAGGNVLVMFPEGTRTSPGTLLGEMKPGFVLIARTARVPIQLVHIKSDSVLLGKGVPWWRCFGLLPGWVHVTLGPRVMVPERCSTVEVAEAVEAWYRNGGSGDLLLRET